MVERVDCEGGGAMMSEDIRGVEGALSPINAFISIHFMSGNLLP